jgi:LemA protein
MEILVVIGVISIAVFYIVSIYNKLVKNRTLAEEGYSGIDVQLKRRADLIPNLVETVKGYMGHEKGTLENITALRTRAQSAGNPEDRLKAEAAISGALANIMMVAENYPQLQASSNFVDLQGQLSQIEEQLQMARRYYNGAVRDLNVMIEQFPSNMVAKHFGFEKKPFFEIENQADREVQKVSFN